MSDKVDSPGTEVAVQRADAMLARTVHDDADRARLAERIVETLQRLQYQGGMRVLLKAAQSGGYRDNFIGSVIMERVLTGRPIGTDLISATHDAIAVAARYLWDAEEQR